MFETLSPRWVRAYNDDATYEIPAGAICEVTDAALKPWTHGVQTDLVLTIRRPTVANARVIAINGPKVIPKDGYGLVCITGITALDITGLSVSVGDSLGSSAGSFTPAVGNTGLIYIAELDHFSDGSTVTGLVKFSNFTDALLGGAHIRSGSDTVNPGDPVGGGTDVGVTPALGVIAGSGSIQADNAGFYHFGFSLTAEAGSDNVGDLMIFGLYNATTPGYTNHYAASENLWDTHSDGSGGTTYVNAHRVNIAMSGIVEAAASDVFDVRNAAAFDITVTHFNFWMRAN